MHYISRQSVRNSCETCLSDYWDGMDDDVNVRGCGSWNGYYGDYVSITSRDLKNPRPKEELFVDKRY